MRYFEVLNESKSSAAFDAIISRVGDKLYGRAESDDSCPDRFVPIDESPKGKAILQYIMDADPTPKGIYVNWIVREYLKGNIQRFEDLSSRVYDVLQRYNELKPTLPAEQKDAMRLDWDKLQTVVEENADVDTRSNTKKEKEFEEILFSTGQAKIYINSQGVKIIELHSREAATHFGKNTRWCTSAANNNMFDNYYEKGTLYCILFKKENKRWQFHFETAQFMDEKDHRICDDEGAVAGFADIISLFSNERIVDSIIKGNAPYMSRYLREPSPEIVHAVLSMFPHLYPTFDNVPYDTLQTMIMRNPNVVIGVLKDVATPEMVNAALRMDSTIIASRVPLDEEQMIIAVSKSIRCIPLGMLASKPTEAVIMAALEKYPENIKAVGNPTKEMIDLAIGRDPMVAYNIDNLSEEQMLRLLDNSPQNIRYIKRPTEKVMQKLVDSSPLTVPFIRGEIPEHIKVAAIRKKPHLLNSFISVTPAMIAAAREV